MIKLNNQQIQALAKKIAKKINDEYNANNNKNRAKALEKFYTTKKGKVVKVFVAVYPKILRDYEINDFMGYEPGPTRASSTAIVDDIILECMECDTIPALITKLTNKYTK